MKTIFIKKKKKSSAPEKINKHPLRIIAIGASAGGLEAVSQLLKNLPPNTGMAFFYVQHLSPDHPSSLPSLLSGSTKMKVQEAQNTLRVKRNNVYICTPNKEMTVIKEKIKLTPRRSDNLPYLPIDDFFNSIAAEYKEHAVGIILSGNATDGTQGLKAIKNAGGITFAQDDSAKYGSMPKSAIDENAVDFILSPREIAKELIRLGKNDFVRRAIPPKENIIPITNPDLKVIFEILHKKTNIDFSHYKLTTIKRRLNYRMLHCGVSTIKEYIKLVLRVNEEANMLCKDLLINVTRFFRDTETFLYLKNTFLPKLLKSKASGETLRVWIPACSTGEEAYSLAMLILDLQADNPPKKPVQIFATDLSTQAIHDARIGEYSQSDIESVPKNSVKRFFIKRGNTYHIVKELREMCVFAPHNILRDPPFSRMDFVSCCNLLIYFDTSAQKKALATLSFALVDGGYLMLGKSETIGTSSQFFKQVNNKFKIYCRKKTTGIRKIPQLAHGFPVKATPDKSIKPAFIKKPVIDSKALDSVIDATLLSRFMPACAIINKDMEILKFRGSTSAYLSHPSGNATLNILKMSRPEFVFELRNAIGKAFKTQKTVCKRDIEMQFDSDFRKMSIEISPLKIEWGEPLLLIVFTLNEQVEKYSEENKAGKNNSGQTRKITKLLEKLDSTRVEMHAVIESQEQAYEKLQAANEEIVSASEEFQTLNEELETSKEEIEASNEELISTNQELQMRNDLLTESYSYSESIIATIHEPIIILDSHFHVKTANKSFYKKFQVTKDKTEGISLFKLGDNQWDIPELRRLLGDILSQTIDFKNMEITHTFPAIGEKTIVFNAQRIIQKAHRERLILLAIEDITERTRHYLKEKELLKKDIRTHEADKLELESAVKHRTRELKKKNIELEKVNKDLTSFTYISSHDLQEPLRKIKNFVSVLLDEEQKNISGSGKKYLQQTQETANRMQELIEDLLAYSRIKDTDRKFEKTGLTVVVNEVKKNLLEIIDKKKAIIKAGNLGNASIIPLQFRQLISNLITNSLKFSKSGTAPQIRIRSEIAQGDKLNSKELSAKTGYCHVIYTDNGMGFDPQYSERIFEVFQRLNAREKFEGTGMGLAICKRIMENHNGLITATGKLNKGARFDIYIPVNSREEKTGLQKPGDYFSKVEGKEAKSN